MFKNAFSQISAGLSTSYNKIKEKISFGRIQQETIHAVNSVFNTTKNAANDENFHTETQQTVENTTDLTKNIIDINQEDSLQVLGDFTGSKVLTLGSEKKQKYKLFFEDGVITKAQKEVHGKYVHENAKTIRKISASLKKSTQKVKKISYNTRRNTLGKSQKNIIKNEKLNGTKKHNDTILRRQKREKIEQEKIKNEQEIKIKEAHMKLDYQTLFRYQTTLSKCNTQGDMINGSEKIAEVVLKTLATRKGITGNNFNKFISSRNKFEVLKKVLKDYLTINSSYSTTGQSDRNSLYNMFINASEIYTTYLSKQKHNSFHQKKKSGPNIYDHELSNDSVYNSEQAKADWVKKYYPDSEAA